MPDEIRKPAENPTSIAGMRQVRRVPRLGFIRLGVKVVKEEKRKACVEARRHGPNEDCMKCTYPRDLDHFVVPPEVAAIYGERPRELDVILPGEDPDKFFPYALKLYTATELRCKGNGVFGWRSKNHMQEDRPPLEDCGRTFKIQCPCSHLKDSIDNPNGDCSAKGTLFVMLPRVSIGGIYQISTGSFYGITGIRSVVDRENKEEGIEEGFLRTLFGHVSLIPLKLRRVETDVTRPDGKRVKKWLLQLTVDKSIDALTAQSYRDGAVLATERTKHLCLPAPDRDISDDRKPIEGVVDAEYEETTQGGENSAEKTADPAKETSSARGSAPNGGAPASASESSPARQREPGEDDDANAVADAAEDEALDAIKAAIRGAKTLQELDQVWHDKVMKNKELEGTTKFQLQDLLLEKKKALKKSK